jgi:ADP-heptose:LPS heptosyltransferase
LIIDSSQWIRISAVLSYCSGSECSVGFKTKGQFRHGAYDLYEEHSSERHELDNFRSLAIVAGGAYVDHPAIEYSDLFSASAYGIKRRFIVLHPWAAGVKKQLREWPETNWKILAANLIQLGYDVVITGGAEDVERAIQLYREIEGSDDVICLAGKLPLNVLASCLLKADGVVSVNTGVMHLAALLGVNVVALNGPTNALRWGGIGKGVFNVNVEPQHGGAFLNLGFEYPAVPIAIMHKITPERVLNIMKDNFLHQ